MKTITKSSKLANVLYDVRGPIVDAARQMEDEGQKIIKLNIGNMAPFGFDPPEEAFANEWAFFNRSAHCLSPSSSRYLLLPLLRRTMYLLVGFLCLRVL